MSTDPADTTDYTTAHRKPPFLRRVRIRNFKSIKFCDVTLEPLTVLVGRNGSGKSNFVEALAFLRDVLTGGVRDAVRKHGDRNTLLWKLATDNSISFMLESAFCAQREPQLWTASYEVEIKLPPKKAPRIAFERLRIAGPNGSPGIDFSLDDGLLVEESSNPQPGKHTQRYARVGNGSEVANSGRVPDRLHLSGKVETPFIEYLEKLESITSYNLHPDGMRKPQREQYGDFLASDGANIASILDSTTECEPEAVDRIRQYLSSLTGGIEFVKVSSDGVYKTLRFRTPSPEMALAFAADSMSDGTLRAFGLLLAAYQVVLPWGNPSIVAIEEPETSLHPAAMHALVDALDEATGRTQILITTHSAELLDNETIKPENVRVVEMVNGETVITPVDEATVEIVKQQLDTLGGLERQNQLSLNDEDRERQQKLATGADAK
jgi:predicted ATPase